MKGPSVKLRKIGRPTSPQRIGQAGRKAAAGHWGANSRVMGRDGESGLASATLAERCAARTRAQGRRKTQREEEGSEVRSGKDGRFNLVDFQTEVTVSTSAYLY